MESYLQSLIKQFSYYKSLADKSIAQIDKPSFFWQPNEQSNSIAFLVKHMAGNMRSRSTDFLTSDGEKPWRKRDEEFLPGSETREELLEKWEQGWKILLDTVASLKNDDLEKIVYIRNEGHTVVEALNRQLAHYSYHIGQIVLLAKVVCAENWTSLSIPKGESETYNAGKFSEEKTRRHFTDRV